MPPAPSPAAAGGAEHQFGELEKVVKLPRSGLDGFDGVVYHDSRYEYPKGGGPRRINRGLALMAVLAAIRV